MDTKEPTPPARSADPRAVARQDARIFLQVLADASNVDGVGSVAFSLLGHQSANGSINAKIPSTPAEAGVEVNLLTRAIDALFEGELAAWNTNKGWIYTRQPRNPQTRRPLSGELRMTEKALREYGSELYKVYFVANDFSGNDDQRRQWKTLPEWRAAMAPLVAPAAAVAPPLKPQASRRVR
jgi:hypothetical protein